MHEPVLLNKVIDSLAFEAGDVFLDATLGEGGHSEAVCRKTADSVAILGIDADGEALERAAQRVRAAGCRIRTAQGNFGELGLHLERFGIAAVDKLLFDLGLRSSELEFSGRGFSLRRDEPLIMTFSDDPSGLRTAVDVLNGWSEEELARIIREYGDERFAKSIARGIAKARAAKPLERTGELVEVVLKHTPTRYHYGRMHPATKTFQAIRMAVNDELEVLRRALAQTPQVLEPGGRVAVISFHSGEDRIVKNFFRDEAKAGRFKVITKKPITAGPEERESNPRSRSAKLRVAEKV